MLKVKKLFLYWTLTGYTITLFRLLFLQPTYQYRIVWPYMWVEEVQALRGCVHTLPCIAVAVKSTANGVHPFQPNSDDVMHGIWCMEWSVYVLWFKRRTEVCAHTLTATGNTCIYVHVCLWCAYDVHTLLNLSLEVYTCISDVILKERTWHDDPPNFQSRQTFCLPYECSFHPLPHIIFTGTTASVGCTYHTVLPIIHVHVVSTLPNWSTLCIWQWSGPDVPDCINSGLLHRNSHVENTHTLKNTAQSMFT